MRMRKLLITVLFVLGTTFTVDAQRNIISKVRDGIASFYHDKFVGRKTSTGEIFSNQKFTAASNTLPLNTYAKVTNLSNGKVIYVKINDRMNIKNTRLIDLARIAAQKLNFTQEGLARVKVEPVPASEGQRGIIAQTLGTAGRGSL